MKPNIKKLSLGGGGVWGPISPYLYHVELGNGTLICADGEAKLVNYYSVYKISIKLEKDLVGFFIYKV